MSNILYSRESLIFQFLSSKEFMVTLAQKDVEPEVHNILLSAHLLAIGFNTTGISEGGVNVDYFQSLAPLENFARSSSNFHFYTTANAIIEETHHSSRSRISLNNEYFRTKYAIDFRDFCLEYYEKYSKHLDLEVFEKKSKNEQESNKISFRMNKRKRNSEDGQKYGYNSVVSMNKNVKSYVEAWYLEKELSLNGCSKKKIKIKL